MMTELMAPETSPMPRLLVLAVLTVSVVGLARSDTKIVREDPVPLRRLCLNAPAIALAVPVDPVTPTKLRVLSPMRGALKVDEVVAPAGLEPDLVRTFEDPDLAEKK